MGCGIADSSFVSPFLILSPLTYVPYLLESAMYDASVALNAQSYEAFPAGRSPLPSIDTSGTSSCPCLPSNTVIVAWFLDIERPSQKIWDSSPNRPTAYEPGVSKYLLGSSPSGISCVSSTHIWRKVSCGYLRNLHVMRAWVARKLSMIHDTNILSRFPAFLPA